jgi:DNA-binding response OmpR family regulator/HPt (histidine-containing phosphotransfer) domain-containing protein
VPSKQDIHEHLAKLEDNFVSKLPLRVAELAALISSLRNHWDTDVAEELYREAHSLAGSGGTFGLAEISDTARVLQHTVQTFAQQESAPDTQQFSALDQLLVELATAISAPALLADRSHGKSMPTGVAMCNQNTTTDINLHSQPIKILIADDDAFSLEHLKLLLEKDGHEIITAENGEQAVSMFREHAPDLVILDVIMPVMNGHDAAKQIKQASGHHFVPILFLTSLESDDDLVKCVEAGGDDFLSKPLNYVVLRARIHALERICGLHSELEVYHQRTEEEIKLSKHVFESITHRNSGNEEAIRYWEAASGHFSGDLVCFQESRSKAQYLMIGDFTGHGLIAALGAIPVSDVFYTMAKQDFALNEISAEVNRTLKLLLPTGRFLAAGFFRIDSSSNKVEYWLGGLPPAMLVDNRGKVSLLKADKLALGILGIEQFDAETHNLSVDDFSNLLLYSDGLTEHMNSDGVMLGEDAVITAIESQHGNDMLDTVINCLQKHADISTADDDITLVNVDLTQFRQAE